MSIFPDPKEIHVFPVVASDGRLNSSREHSFSDGNVSMKDSPSATPPVMVAVDGSRWRIRRPASGSVKYAS